MDADDLAVEIEKRPAGVAAHDRAIGADDAVVVIEDPAQADHGGTALANAAWMSDGDAPLAVADVHRVSHFHEGPLALFGNLDESAIDGSIRAQGLGLDLAAVEKNHGGIAARLTGGPEARELAAWAEGFRTGLIGFAVAGTFISAQFEKFFWVIMFLSIVIGRRGRRCRLPARCGSPPCSAWPCRRRRGPVFEPTLDHRDFRESL